MTLITGIANFKGGVTKTKTTLNLAVSLKKMKQRVLLIDTDSLGNVIVLNKAK